MYSVGVIALELFAVTRTRSELLALIHCLQRKPPPAGAAATPDAISPPAVHLFTLHSSIAYSQMAFVFVLCTSIIRAELQSYTNAQCIVFGANESQSTKVKS